MTSSVKRGTVTVLTTLIISLAVAAAAFACVPQRGTLVVESLANGTQSSKVVGDGTQDLHFNGWCEHPTDAAYLGNGDDFEVTVDKALLTDDGEGCPETVNKLPQGTNDVLVNNGEAYTWNATEGYWDFEDGDAKGCFAPGVTNEFSDTMQVDATGSGNKTFTLSGMTTENTHDGDFEGDPGEDASVLCVGAKNDDGDQVGIFAPLVVTSV